MLLSPQNHDWLYMTVLSLLYHTNSLLHVVSLSQTTEDLRELQKIAAVEGGSRLYRTRQKVYVKKWTVIMCVTTLSLSPQGPRPLVYPTWVHIWTSWYPLRWACQPFYLMPQNMSTTPSCRRYYWSSTYYNNTCTPIIWQEHNFFYAPT